MTSVGPDEHEPQPAEMAERPHGTDAPGDEATDDYGRRLSQEQAIYQDVGDVNQLPGIFHYWSNRYLRPMLEEVGASNPDQFFAKYLQHGSPSASESAPVFLSVGAGNCDTEVRLAKILLEGGLETFTIQCMDVNAAMLHRGQEMALAEGVAQHIEPLEVDFNKWRPDRSYAGIMANQSLHHVAELEWLFGSIKEGLAPGASFVVSDMIGRNGHLRWPEALREVNRFWTQMPPSYRYNHQLKRHEDVFDDWDCSGEGFEGVRAQDILRLLMETFHFSVFVGFGNVVDPFVDRSFGPNFDPEGLWDQHFIDRVHACDEAGFRNGVLTPTHLMAVMQVEPVDAPFLSRGLGPVESRRDGRG